MFISINGGLARRCRNYATFKLTSTFFFHLAARTAARDLAHFLQSFDSLTWPRLPGESFITICGPFIKEHMTCKLGFFINCWSRCCRFMVWSCNLRRDFWILKSWVALSLPHYLPSCPVRGGVSTQLFGPMNSSKISPLGACDPLIRCVSVWGINHVRNLVNYPVI